MPCGVQGDNGGAALHTASFRNNDRMVLTEGWPAFFAAMRGLVPESAAAHPPSSAAALWWPTRGSRARSATLLEHYCGVTYTLCGDQQEQEQNRRDILGVEAAPATIVAAMAAHMDAPVLLGQCSGALACLAAAGAGAKERVCRSMASLRAAPQHTLGEQPGRASEMMVERGDQPSAAAAGQKGGA